MKKIIYFLILLSPIAVSAKEFTVNCLNSSNDEFIYTFDDVKKTATTGALIYQAFFTENEITFSWGNPPWTHVLSRVTGNMTATKNNTVVYFKCSIVNKRLF